MSDQSKPCPVDKIESGLDDETFADQVWSACQSCPNRAPSQADAEMLEVILGALSRRIDEDWLRKARAVVKKYPKGGAA